MSGKKGLGWRILLGVCIALFAAAAVMLVLYFRPTDEPIVSMPSAPLLSSPNESSQPELLPDNPIDFGELQRKNADAVAWIRVPGTVIDYPVMRSGEGVAENFYIDHAPDGSARRAGSIYMQKINTLDFSDPNTVLYGHYMANGSMFADLHQFRKADFFNKYQYIYVYTPGHILTYRIYTAFVYDNRHILNSFNFRNPDHFASFLEQSRNPVSMHKQLRDEVEVTTDDRIITLSTCTMRDSERYLVEGVLIDDQPTT